MRLSSLFILALFACGGGNSGPISLERQTFAPSLNVDLAASTRTTNGVYYRDLVHGTGAVALAHDGLDVDYTGWIADGSEFSSSQGTGTYNFVLGVGSVLSGWDEGLAGVAVGTTRQLIIPAALGYGSRGGDGLPPNSNLVYQVVVHASARSAPVEQTSFAASLNVNLGASVKTANGVYVRDLTAGSGAAAAPGQTLTVDYIGWLPDGTKFDASQDSGTTFSFIIGKGKVIAGWDEGLSGVQAGATRKLVIPAQLAYGVTGQNKIPPFANLVFDIVVHSIQ